MIQIDVIMICAVIMAIEPARRLSREYINWRDRREANRRHLESVKGEQNG